MRDIYLYLVCLVMLVVMVVGLINFVHSTINLFNPNAYVSYVAADKALTDQVKSTHPGASDQEISKLVAQRLEEQKKQQEAQARFSRWVAVGRAAGTILVSLPFYLYHWRMIQRNASA